MFYLLTEMSDPRANERPELRTDDQSEERTGMFLVWQVSRVQPVM